MLDIGDNFAKDINTGKIKLFCYYRGCPHSSAAIEQFGFISYFINEHGNRVNILPDIKSETILPELTSNSRRIPDRAYRVSVEKINLKRNDDGTTYSPATLQIYFKPTHHDASIWTITEVEAQCFLLKHSLMGELCMPKCFKKNAKTGQKVTLLSEVIKTSEGYQLEYEIIN